MAQTPASEPVQTKHASKSESDQSNVAEGSRVKIVGGAMDAIVGGRPSQRRRLSEPIR
jgi:hypothetical protein